MYLSLVITAALMIAMGLLGASAFIVAKKPDAAGLINKLVPIQGIVGIVGLVMCVLGILASLSPFYLMGVVANAVGAALGFLLGFGLIAKFALSGSKEAMAKGEKLRSTLAVFQVPFGLASIGLGIYYLLFALRIL